MGHDFGILFRPDRDTEDEMKIAAKYFPVFTRRTEIPDGFCCIPRYSALPYYRELQEDLKFRHSDIINTYAQHRWIANFEYYEQLKDFTFETWTEADYRSSGYEGPVVVKGKTNSRKHTWNKSMYAENPKRALEISRTLEEDTMIGTQGTIFRRFVPLKTLEVGLFGLPFTNEFRFFFYKEHLLGHGFYWNNMCDCPEKANLTNEGIEFAKSVASIAKNHTNFFVLDIAEKDTGGWILVEVNCGTMSGLSDISPDNLYSNLRGVLCA